VTRLAKVCFWMGLVLVTASESSAHSRSESYSHWHLSENTITGVVTIPVRDVMVLHEQAIDAVPTRVLFQNHLRATTEVSANGESCAQTGSNILQAAAGFIRVELKFDCAGYPPQHLGIRTMFDVAPAHAHYAKLYQDGQLVGEALITDTADTWEISGLQSATSWSFASFVSIGIEHIASGFDHVAFLLGLLLIAGSFRRCIVAVTGFTLGHSISLAAAVLGYVHADGQLVEAFIGFTIFLVAAEYFLPRQQSATRFAAAGALLAWLTGLAAFSLGFIDARALFAYAGFGMVAACYLLMSGKLIAQENTRATALLFVATCSFGLVHGFGFAGFLIETGLLGSALIVPLLGFNLGVELGQLILVSLALLLSLALRRHTPQVLPQLAAAALAGVGIFWFIGRTLA